MIDERTAAEMRALYPRVLGKTLRFAGRLADAEDAVHDAFERALVTWSESGRPDSLEGWLVHVAANRIRDRARRDRRDVRNADALATLASMSPWVQGAIGEIEIARGWKDDLLRLLFACCHPDLETGESAALALSTILGLANAEIATAFAVAPRSMDQRLTRARRRLRETEESEVPPTDRARDRIPAVLATIYLLFNEGYWSSLEDAPIRTDLCRLAVGLGRSLREAFPDEPEILGLLALTTLHDARRAARLDASSAPVTLQDQDRSRWDHAAIAEGAALVEAALALGKPGPYQIEAAISAVHSRAATASETDWTQIAELYEILERMRPIASVRVNRAFATARARGPAEGLALLGATDVDVGNSHYAELVRGALLEETGQRDEAVRALERAVAGARNPHERDQIRARLERLRTKSSA